MTFLNSISKKSKKHEFPFEHWEYDNALSDGPNMVKLDDVESIIKDLW